MPYDAIADLPDAVKELPKPAQEIYLKAFNTAFKQYDGNEGQAHATAWAAVKKKYHKNDAGTWESDPGGMSAEFKKSLLQTALLNEYHITHESPIPSGVVVEEVFDDAVVYNIDGQAYKVGYTFKEDGTPTFGQPEKVAKQTVYNPSEAVHPHGEHICVCSKCTKEAIVQESVKCNTQTCSVCGGPMIAKEAGERRESATEALQAKYSEVLREAGKRNAALDAARVKKIVELCQELLSSEEPDEAAIKKATKEAAKVLTWLETQPIVNIEEGTAYPASAYAYVPDTNDPVTWKLRLREGDEITKPLLDRASASLSPGGYKGQKIVINARDLPEVKRRIRSEYRNLGVEDMSKWVTENESREEIRSYIPLTEATFDKGRATVIVIKPGFNATEDRYYPADMLKRDYKVFEGMKMYADHPTEEEDKARPERSIKDWVATLSEVTCDEAGVVTGVAEIVEPWLMSKLASLRDKQMLSEMGISINAIGSASKATIDNKETLVIEKLVACRSVDFVTEPGAGGIVTFYESDRSRDIDLIDLLTLKEKRPDLVSAIEATVKAEITKEVKKAMENDGLIQEKDDQIATLTKERDELKEAAEQAVKVAAKAEAQAAIKEAVDQAELPNAAKERLLEQFKDAESADGITEAITGMTEFIAKLSEAGKVVGLGATKVNSEEDRKALTESFKGMGLSDAEAEVAAKGS